MRPFLLQAKQHGGQGHVHVRAPRHKLNLHKYNNTSCISIHRRQALHLFASSDPSSAHAFPPSKLARVLDALRRRRRRRRRRRLLLLLLEQRLATVARELHFSYPLS